MEAPRQSEEEDNITGEQHKVFIWRRGCCALCVLTVLCCVPVSTRKVSSDL